MAVETIAITATATTAGTAALLSLLISRQCSVEEKGRSGSVLSRSRIGPRRPLPPSTLLGTAATVAKTLKFAFVEILVKWPIMDLMFGIKYLSRRQGNQSVASICAASSPLQLKGPEKLAELIHLLRLLNLCMLFSKKPFPEFLEYAGCPQEDVLFKQPKAGLLKPAFIILRDTNSKCILLIVRGLHSINDTLTAATGSIVPFHYSILHEAGVSMSVLGYTHCGMLAAARWVAKCIIPCLRKAVTEYPTYNIKIVGNSLGGAIAALLTYILREHVEFSSSTCIAFAPAACVTWDIAESGEQFITTIINGADTVPSCSLASLDNLRAEIRASSWLCDFWSQIQPLRYLSGSRDIRSRTQIQSQFVMNGEHSTEQTASETGSPLSASLCMSGNRCSPKVFGSPQESSPTEELGPCSMGKDKRVLKAPMCIDPITATSTGESVTNSKLKFELGTEEGSESKNQLTKAVNAFERHRFFPPGRIMHMISMPKSTTRNQGERAAAEQTVEIYEIPRQIYGKIRLSPTMIKDHYMPTCKKTMELLIDKLKRDQEGCSST